MTRKIIINPISKLKELLKIVSMTNKDNNAFYKAILVMYRMLTEFLEKEQLFVEVKRITIRFAAGMLYATHIIISKYELRFQSI